MSKAEFCKDCYLWSDEPKVIKLCPLHATAAELLAALIDLSSIFGRAAPQWIRAHRAITAAEKRDAD